MVAILFIASRFPFDYISPNNTTHQTDQYRKGTCQGQGIGAIEAFEYENARRDFVGITEKIENQYVRPLLKVYTRDPRGIFPCIDGFTVNPAVQCDIQV